MTRIFGNVCITGLLCTGAIFADPPAVVPDAAAVLHEETSWYKNHEKAAQKAAQENKLIVVDLYTDWCSWCKKLEKETYPAPAVQAVLRQFVPLKLNPETDGFGQKLMNKAGARGFPATVVTDAEWNVVKLISGYRPPESYATELTSALEPYKRLTALEKLAGREELDAPGMLELIEAGAALGQSATVRKYGAKYLDILDTEKRAKVSFFLAATYPVDSAEYKRFKETALADGGREVADDFLLHEVISVLNSIGGREDADSKLREAATMLESRVDNETSVLNPDKGQQMYWILFQIHNMQDKKKAAALLRRGIKLNPDSEMGRGMSRILEQTGG